MAMIKIYLLKLIIKIVDNCFQLMQGLFAVGEIVAAIVPKVIQPWSCQGGAYLVLALISPRYIFYKELRMCAQITTVTSVEMNTNDAATLSKQEQTAYKGRRGRLCGSRCSKPWRIQGGPSIYGGLGGAQR
ncbi:MAG: hypothetical protein R3Y11_05665 [Pseudomonadota bacterium]